jgi:outer membrane lipoprotein carrier protein
MPLRNGAANPSAVKRTMGLFASVAIIALLALPLELRAGGSPAATAKPNASPAGAKSGRPVPIENVDKTVRALQRRYHEIKSLRAKFTESITPAGAPTRNRDGVVYLRMPGRMRWQFDSPTRELVVSDGSTLYTYDPDLNQVVEAPLKQVLRAPGATEFLLGMGNLSRDFEASAVEPPPADGLIHLKLRSRRGGNTIELGLVPATYDIATLEITDALGNVTRLSFSDIDDNVKISDSMFAFTVPAGADIVRPTLPD